MPVPEDTIPEDLARPLAPAIRPTLLERVQELRDDSRVALAIVLIVIVAAGVVWFRSSGSDAAPRTSTTVDGSSVPAASPTTIPTHAVVHVVGAVRAPGVVELEADARVRDALAAAGGPADDADVERLNLAAPITDGQRIAVPKIGAPDPAPIAGDASVGGDTAAGPLNLNMATAGDLEALPGIGPTLAEAIVRERERRGGFSSVEDLKQVRGIGEARFADIRELVSV